MGLFFSKRSRNSTTTNNTNNYSTHNEDNRIAADNGAIVARDGATVTVTDGGAIKLAGEVAEQGLDLGYAFASMAQEMAMDVSGRGFELAETSQQATIDTLQKVIDQDRADDAQLSDKVVNMIPVIVIGVVLWGVMK